MRPFGIIAIVLFFLTPAVTLSAGTTADTEYAKRLELAEAIVELSQGDQMMEQITQGMLQAQTQALDLVFTDSDLTERQRESIINEIAQVISEELEPAMGEFNAKTAPLLADVYTLEELQGILDFYKSPPGKAMLAKQSELIEKSLLIGQEWNNKNLPEVVKRMIPRIEEIIETARNEL